MPDRSSVLLKESACVFSEKSGLAFRMVFLQHELDTYAKEKGLWKNDAEKKTKTDVNFGVEDWYQLAYM